MPTPTPKTTRPAARYFAMAWAYGRGVTTGDDCRRAVTYHVFPTRAARDEWAAGGPAFRGERGYREEVDASDAELRRMIRRNRSGCEYMAPERARAFETTGMVEHDDA